MTAQLPVVETRVRSKPKMTMSAQLPVVDTRVRSERHDDVGATPVVGTRVRTERNVTLTG